MWRTAIQNHNSHDVITNGRVLIWGEPFEEIPWYCGWKAMVVKEHDRLFSMFWLWRIAPTTVEVVEMPLEVWTEKDEKHQETPIELKEVRVSTEHNKISTARFVVESCEELDDAEVLQQLKLTVTIEATNMHPFDWNLMIKRYEGWKILSEFCPLQTEMQGDRKIIVGMERDV